MTTEVPEVGPEWKFRTSVIARFSEPVLMPTATVATVNTLYPAADWPGCSVYLSDGASNKFIAISNGSAWRYADGSAV